MLFRSVVIIIAVIIAMCVTSKKGAMRIKALERNKESQTEELLLENAEGEEATDEGILSDNESESK